MHFTKMNGTGNDYIFFYLENIQDNQLFNKNVIKKLCNRHTGIGGDGIVIINKSTNADARMIIFNADGTRAEMCGNALRCVATYINKYNLNKNHQNTITIITDSGVKYAEINNRDSLVTVNMGKPQIDFNLIHINSEISGYKINMGNPHFVVVTNDLDNLFVKYAKTISNNIVYFPHKTNVEFAHFLNPTNIKMRVWERGSEETLACGTGASAVFALICYLNNVTTNITLHLPGGILNCEYNSCNEILLTGNTEINFEGNIEI